MAEPRKRTGPVTPPAPPQQVPPPSSTTASITDLSDWRQRRLLAPWPGWWGGAEIRSWTWAERTRGRWSA